MRRKKLKFINKTEQLKKRILESFINEAEGETNAEIKFIF